MPQSRPESPRHLAQVSTAPATSPRPMLAAVLAVALALVVGMAAGRLSAPSRAELTSSIRAEAAVGADAICLDAVAQADRVVEAGAKLNASAEVSAADRKAFVDARTSYLRIKARCQPLP